MEETLSIIASIGTIVTALVGFLGNAKNAETLRKEGTASPQTLLMLTLCRYGGSIFLTLGYVIYWFWWTQRVPVMDEDEYLGYIGLCASLAVVAGMAAIAILLIWAKSHRGWLFPSALIVLAILSILLGNVPPNSG